MVDAFCELQSPQARRLVFSKGTRYSLHGPFNSGKPFFLSIPGSHVHLAYKQRLGVMVAVALESAGSLSGDDQGAVRRNQSVISAGTPHGVA